LRRDPRTIASAELMLSEQLLRYADHLANGRTAPSTQDPDWHIEREPLTVGPILARGVAAGHLQSSLAEMAPNHPAYDPLRATAAELTDTVARGGWTNIPTGPKLKLGDRDARVVPLRKRLLESRYTPTGQTRLAAGQAISLESQAQALLQTVNRDAAEATDPAPPVESDVYDPALADEVRRFQAQHGLAVDAVIGPATIAALNVPAEVRLSQVLTTLERMRWLPRELGERHVFVNLAAYRLDLVEGGISQLSMPVIVGRRDRQTPALSDRIEQLVLNPYWNVPRSIARRDIVPKLSREPDYLARKGIRIFSDWQPGATELSLDQVDLASAARDGFPHRLRQDPGPANALGRVKFLFPNAHAIYLHDTPQRNLFNKTRRAFSSGCVRLARPVELANHLLERDRGWDPDKVRRMIDSGDTRHVKLRTPVPVHLVYWTAWVDPAGMVQFREDLYKRDRQLMTAISPVIPAPRAAIPVSGL